MYIYIWCGMLNKGQICLNGWLRFVVNLLFGALINERKYDDILIRPFSQTKHMLFRGIL